MPDEVRFTLRLPEDLWRSLSQLASRSKRSLNNEIVARLSGESLNQERLKHLSAECETLRDSFAMAALVGMMQARCPYSSEPERNAETAYSQADAMLAARTRRRAS